MDNLKLTIGDNKSRMNLAKQKTKTNKSRRVFQSNLLTLGDVSKIMKVSQKTVQRWIKSKKLRAARIGHKTYRIWEKDLAKFVNDHIK